MNLSKQKIARLEKQRQSVIRDFRELDNLVSLSNRKIPAMDILLDEYSKAWKTLSKKIAKAKSRAVAVSHWSHGSAF